MNLLKNRELLRAVLWQGDALNTVQGGVVEPVFALEEEENAYIINITAPSVRPDHYDITLDKSRLSITAIIDQVGENRNGKYGLPLFTRFLDLPAHVDIDFLEAVHDGKHLSIILPFRKTDHDDRRKISIKNL